MKKIVSRLTAVFAFLLFLSAAAASHAEAVRANVGEILRNPGSFEGRAVQVEGVVVNLRDRLFSNGTPYSTFRLADRNGDFVNVMSTGEPRIKEGDIAGVIGVFQKARYSSGIAVYNEIETSEQMVARIQGQR